MAKGCCSFGCLCKIAVLLPLTLVAIGAFIGGNYTHIANMAQRGMPSSEDASKFGDAYTKVSGNEQHNAYDGDIAESFYNLATDFYEYGWGDSFHFGFRQRHEAHRIGILNTQNFLAQKLGVGEGDRVLDMGCGIGGPLRQVVRMTGAHVTGVTINQHQINRAKEITSDLPNWMQQRCKFVQDDYLDVKNIEQEAYDAAYYMEASLHCENRTQTFEQTYRLLKPGGTLVLFEYYLLDGWDEKNPEHTENMRKHLYGNGSARTPSIKEGLKQVTDAGFEIQEHFDFMARGNEIYGDSVWQWWEDLQPNLRLKLPPAHPWIRTPLPYILRAFSFLGLIPEEVPDAAELMNVGGDGLSMLGKLGAITPQYFVLATKPAGKSAEKPKAAKTEEKIPEAQKPAKEKPVQPPTPEKPAAKPSTETPTPTPAEKPAAKPAADKPVPPTEKPAPKPATETPPTEKPAPKPSTEKPVPPPPTEKPAPKASTDKPMPPPAKEDDKPAQPATEKPASQKPAAEKQASDAKNEAK